MGDTNLSAVLFKKGDMRLVDRPMPEPGPGEVQLSMRKAGICGSDVHIMEEGALGPRVAEKPMILGHECSAVVSKLGQGVTNFKIGDRVAIEPGVPCLRCEMCKAGRYNLCFDMYTLSIPPYTEGAFARFIVHPAEFCYKLADNVSLEEGAMVEPLSVGINGCRRANVAMGKKVLVCGSGPIGLCVIAAARAMGASDIIVTDLLAERLELAKQMGATKTLKIESKDPAEVAQQVRDSVGAMPDCAVEASGAQFSVQMAIRALKPGSALAVVGIGPSEILIPILQAITYEIDIRATVGYTNTWPTAIEMLAAGLINVKPMISHHYPLEQTVEAFEMAKSGKGVKVIIDCEKKTAS